MLDKNGKEVTDETSIREIDSFGVRVINALIGEDIFSIGQLMKLCERETRNIPNIGVKSLKEITIFKDMYTSKKRNNAKQEEPIENKKYQLSEEDFFASENKESYKLFCDFMEKFFDHKFILFRNRIFKLESSIYSEHRKLQEQIRNAYHNDKKDFGAKIERIYSDFYSEKKGKK